MGTSLNLPHLPHTPHECTPCKTKVHEALFQPRRIGLSRHPGFAFNAEAPCTKHVPAPLYSPALFTLCAFLRPPVPKLDLGGILQRRAEEQATEPVFMVAASCEDPPEPSGSSTHLGGVDKRKSGSRQPSAKEDPAEHFYL